MMRIIIDLQAAQSESRFRGIGRYSLSLSIAMARQADKNDIWIMLNDNFPESIGPIRRAFEGLVPKERFAIFSHPAPTAGIYQNNGWRVRGGEYLREHFLTELQPDIVHVASLFEGWCDNAVTSVGSIGSTMPTACTLYDLIPFIQRKTYLSDVRMREYYFRKIRSLYNADLLLAISEHTKLEALAALNLPESRIATIFSAVDDHFAPQTFSIEERAKVLNRYGITKSFVMCAPGGFDSRKNIKRLIEAYAQLPANLRQAYQLVITSKILEQDRSALNQYAKNKGPENHEMVLTGYVPDEDLVSLYNLCTLFVLPSLHEGFGMPALEAMASGAPVIGSNQTSIPEVIGREDALFDPNRTEAMTRSISHALNDSEFRQSLREHATRQAAKFSWDESARRALAAFEVLHEQNSTRQRNLVPVSPRKSKLAFVSPLPPEKSGIADYSADLLPELARYYDITLIVDQISVEPLWANAVFSIRDVSWFENNVKRFDRILYQFGNSPYHKHMFGLLERHPGVVVLHDFYLSSALRWMDDSGYATGCFRQALYGSHGYAALAAQIKDWKKDIIDWPCNKDVLDNAVGAIVHSRYSMDAARRWYNPVMPQTMRKIPQLMSIPKIPIRRPGPASLKISKDTFIVCSFGILAPTKLNVRLLDAWIASTLAKDPCCQLIFVGENHEGEYGRTLKSKIRKRGLEDRIRITGFVSMEKYRDYLEAADIAVQLRTHSRGETSRALLETMAYALPVVINANGPMAEYPDDVLVKLPDDFEDAALIKALESLRQDSKKRNMFGQAARKYVIDHHSPEKVGKQYFEAIEHLAVNGPHHRYQHLLASLGAISQLSGQYDYTYAPSEKDLAETALSIAANTPRPRQKQLLLDISTLTKTDLKTGIERVARSIMLELIKCPPEGFRVEPVYRDGENYRYANRLTLEMLDIVDCELYESVIDVQKGDIYLSLEWNPALVIDTKKQLLRWRNNGVDLFFIIFDLLPLLMPNNFPAHIPPLAKDWLANVSDISTGLTCISRSVYVEVEDWLASHPPKRFDPLSLSYFPLGADIENSAPTRGFQKNSSTVLEILKNAYSFLMVGTIEPRKGHLQTMKAFTKMWNDGFDINLVIVGREGWRDLPDVQRRTIPETIKYLREHPERGRRLFWLEGISDEYLEKVYAASTCLIAAAEGEGFGLPLIEAAKNGLPIIAREIPVFREVAGKSAFYFEGNTDSDLVDAIKEWLNLFEKNQNETTLELQWQTWKESAATLASIVVNGKYSV